jgi:hypothetical protein
MLEKSGGRRSGRGGAMPPLRLDDMTSDAL